VSKLILGRYRPQELWLLFLMCALPLHAWTLILAFNDLSWLTERTNAWDAFGVLCYGLLFALIESILLFVVAAVLGLLVPGRWTGAQRMALLGSFVLVLSVWAMISQAFFLLNLRLPDGLIALMVNSAHPLRTLYMILLALVGASFLLPAWVVLRGRSGLRLMGVILERLGTLAMLYLAFDAAAVVVVLIRNL